MAFSKLQLHPGTPLWRYWTHGEGAGKIGWGTPGSYMRGIAELGKYVHSHGMLYGLVANMYLHVTGHTPPHRHGNRGHHGHLARAS